MIVSFILTLVFYTVLLITLPVRVFPDASMPSWIAGAISQANVYLSTGKAILPVTITTILLTWGVYLGVELALFIYKGVMWIVKKIPGVS